MSRESNRHNIRKNGKFVKKKRLDRDIKIVRARAAKAAAKRQREQTEESALQTFLDTTMDGRRVIDTKMLWAEMWCKGCNRGLCFRDIVQESVRGLACIWKLRCTACSKIIEVRTSDSYYDNETCRQRYTVNAKVIFGMIDAGIGHEKINKVLSALNIPCLDDGMIARAQTEVGEAVIEVAKESCKEALVVEKQLTEMSPIVSVATQGPCGSPSDGAQ